MDNFTGTSVIDLARAIVREGGISNSPDDIGLPVAEKKSIDSLRVKYGKPLNFYELLRDYKNNEDNPIMVELPGK